MHTTGTYTTVGKQILVNSQLVEGQGALVGGARVELGCGGGRFAALLTGFNVVSNVRLPTLLLLAGMAIGLLPIGVAVGVLNTFLAIYVDSDMIAVAQCGARF